MNEKEFLEKLFFSLGIQSKALTEKMIIDRIKYLEKESDDE